jgi:hypothetical protein
MNFAILYPFAQENERIPGYSADLGVTCGEIEECD